jgi:hypothetical protein
MQAGGKRQGQERKAKQGSGHLRIMAK